MNQLISKQYAGLNHILNPQRHYVPSSRTDIRETFARLREQQQEVCDFEFSFPELNEGEE